MPHKDLGNGTAELGAKATLGPSSVGFIVLVYCMALYETRGAATATGLPAMQQRWLPFHRSRDANMEQARGVGRTADAVMACHVN